MATNHTPNLSLPQWDALDPFQHTEFNEAFATLDTAVSENTAAVANCAKLAYGSYKGNGSEKRTITLDFTPKAVALWTRWGSQYHPTADNVQGGLCLENLPCQSSNSVTAFSIVNNGFEVNERPAYKVSCNYNNSVYYYLAFA